MITNAGGPALLASDHYVSELRLLQYSCLSSLEQALFAFWGTHKRIGTPTASIFFFPKVTATSTEAS